MTGEPKPDADPEFADLLDSLPISWAHLPVDQDGELLAAAYLRAAYGRGYVQALTERVAA